MGCSYNTSSGLHHDFHDNFYMLLKGKKVIRLYSPDCAPLLNTFGEIQKIHSNGVISYHADTVGADGKPVDEDEEASSGDDDEEEEEFVIGKGFDYVSDGEDDDCKVEHSDKDDFEDLVASDHDEATDDDTPRRPNNFSRIDLNHKNLSKDYPLLQSKCKECLVVLKAGQTLYMPAGWFHEVTSSSASDNIHLALNYWYHPPTDLKD